MSIAFALAIYFIIWWIVLFAMLPIGVRTAEEAGEKASPGTAESAPLAAAPAAEDAGHHGGRQHCVRVRLRDRRPSRDHARRHPVLPALRAGAIGAGSFVSFRIVSVQIRQITAKERKKKQGRIGLAFQYVTPCLPSLAEARPSVMTIEKCRLKSGGAHASACLARLELLSSQDLDLVQSQRVTSRSLRSRTLPRCGSHTNVLAPNCHHDCDLSPQIYARAPLLAEILCVRLRHT